MPAPHASNIVIICLSDYMHIGNFVGKEVLLTLIVPHKILSLVSSTFFITFSAIFQHLLFLYNNGDQIMTEIMWSGKGVHKKFKLYNYWN